MSVGDLATWLECILCPLETFCSWLALGSVVGANSRSVVDQTTWLELMHSPLEIYSMSVGDIPAICWPCVMLLELISGPLETQELGWSVFYVRWRHFAIGWPWVNVLELIAGPLETKELGWSVFYVRWRPNNLVGVNA